MIPDRTQALLTSVADELADMRASLDDLADLASDLIAGKAEATRDAVLARAQGYDLLRQRLDALSGLLAALGAGVSVDLALHALSLSDLSRRLGGAVAPPDPSVAGDGDVHLF